MPARRYCFPDPFAVLTDAIITQEIDPGSRVIDLGCGGGRLLKRLRDAHGCDVLGVELDMEEIVSAFEQGIPVVQADLDRGLPDIPDGAFDFAVLSQTLQQVRQPKEVLSEILRIARRALVVVPNFAHWKVRLQVVRQGRAPVTDSLPYAWYESPNLHFMSLSDVRDLVAQLGMRVVKERPIIRGRAVDRAWAANLRADSALYIIERNGEVASGGNRGPERASAGSR